MTGEKDLNKLIRSMKPKHVQGEYVFCTIPDPEKININEIILLFKEDEGYTIIIKKELADQLKLEYSFIAAWISLTIHSSLEAVGLTATFSSALASENISCNVVAGVYHDHLFVDKKDVTKAMEVMEGFSK
ncbi:MAG: ACT domain-containing protein [Ferruginibacter sp.]